MERVIGDDDLLEEILLRLPAEIVHACKPVSKRWCSLISSLCFRRRHGTFHRHTASSNMSKLLLFDHEEKTAMTLLDISDGVLKTSNIESAKLLSSIKPYYEKLRQKIDESKEVDFRICDTYNGLFLFSLTVKKKQSKIFYFDRKELYCVVCNPLTNEYKKLPLLRKHKSAPLTQLAFAPSKDSSYYKVVVAYDSQVSHDDFPVYIVHVYSSQTRSWKDSKRLRRRDLSNFKYVVWDNCLFLANREPLWAGFIRFLDLERLCVSTSSSLLPRDPTEMNGNCRIHYFGESGGCLYVIAEDEHYKSVRGESKYMLWEMKGIDGSLKEKFQFNNKKDITFLHVHRDSENVWLLTWDISTGKVYYCKNGNAECLQEAGDVARRYRKWNIRYHTPTLFPLHNK